MPLTVHRGPSCGCHPAVRNLSIDSDFRSSWSLGRKRASAAETRDANGCTEFALRLCGGRPARDQRNAGLRRGRSTRCGSHDGQPTGSRQALKKRHEGVGFPHLSQDKTPASTNTWSRGSDPVPRQRAPAVLVETPTLARRPPSTLGHGSQPGSAAFIRPSLTSLEEFDQGI